ncbi:MAG: catalase family protein [Thalassotalea sp.]
MKNSNDKLHNGIDEPPEEKTYIANIISSAVGMVDLAHQAAVKEQPKTPYHRDVHAKAHGCLKATFSVPENLDENLRYGVFKQAGDFQAWVRYSSGDTRFQADSKRDARGMAIKLMNIDQPTLLTDPQDTGSQDFVMINNDVFFIPSVKEYMEFMQYQAIGSKFGYFFNNFNWNIFTWHFRQLYLGGSTLKSAPKSLLKEQYHSLSAYRLGPTQFMKYSAKACNSNKEVEVDRDKANFLRTELEKNLSSNSACFDFMVQLQNPSKNMPVEDTTIKWQEDDSPFIKVATLTIAPQQFNSDAQNNFCENLSFTPWHGTKDIEPVGGINRLRKAVYDGISRYRHGKNGIAKQEPKGWCLQLNGEACAAE